MAKGTSGYMKPKGQTIKELDAALGEPSKAEPDRNAIDRVHETLVRQNDLSKGITEKIRNIFEK